MFHAATSPTPSNASAIPVGAYVQITPLTPPSDLWLRIRDSQSIPGRQNVIPPNELGSEIPDSICPEATAVWVDMVNTEGRYRSPIHANVVSLERTHSHNTSEPKNSQAIAGQSPQQFAQCEKFLMQGLDSGQGLFQFVSSKAHVDPQGSVDNPVLFQLQNELENCKKQNQPLVLGGRYEVFELDESSPITDIDPQVRCCQLRVRDLHKNVEISVPLTQVGLRYTDKLLRVAQIVQADEAMKNHIAQVGPRASAASGKTAPMVLSARGIGRNATLICYREVLARIKEEGLTENQLDNALEEVISAGRRDRGPRFVHTDAQLQQLRAALVAALDTDRCEAAPPAAAAQHARSSFERRFPETTPIPAPVAAIPAGQSPNTAHEPSAGSASPLRPTSVVAPHQPVPLAPIAPMAGPSRIRQLIAALLSGRNDFESFDIARACASGRDGWHIERQQSLRCGQHAVNALLNQAYFTDARADQYCRTTFGEDYKNNQDTYAIKDASGNYSVAILSGILNQAMEHLDVDQRNQLLNAGLSIEYGSFHELRGALSEQQKTRLAELFAMLSPSGNNSPPQIRSFILGTGAHYIACRWIDGCWRNLDSFGDGHDFANLESRRIDDIKTFIEAKRAVGLIMGNEFVLHFAT